MASCMLITLAKIRLVQIDKRIILSFTHFFLVANHLHTSFIKGVSLAAVPLAFFFMRHVYT